MNEQTPGSPTREIDLRFYWGGPGDGLRETKKFLGLYPWMQRVTVRGGEYELLQRICVYTSVSPPIRHWLSLYVARGVDPEAAGRTLADFWSSSITRATKGGTAD